MRSLSFAVIGVIGIAHADPAPPAIDAALAAKLKRGGWADPVIAHRSASLTVVSARRGRTRHFVIASAAGTLIDGGVAPAGATVAERSLAPTGLIELQIGTRTPRANKGYSEATQILVLRENGTVACKLPGSSSTNTGTRCGSGGWTSVSLRGSLGADATTTIDVTSSSSGTYTESDGKGGCRHRSPVRSSPTRSRYSIAAKGICKKIAVPAGDTPYE